MEELVSAHGVAFEEVHQEPEDELIEEVTDEVDQELTRRGLRFCRYADDVRRR